MVIGILLKQYLITWPKLNKHKIRVFVILLKNISDRHIVEKD